MTKRKRGTDQGKTTKGLTIRCDKCQHFRTAKNCRRCENVKRMMRQYNLTQEVAELFTDKKIPCVICRTTENVGADHCHILGVYRGALCTKHNTAFGYLNEDPILIRRLLQFAEYAEKLKAGRNTVIDPVIDEDESPPVFKVEENYPSP